MRAKFREFIEIIVAGFFIGVYLGWCIFERFMWTVGLNIDCYLREDKRERSVQINDR